MQRLHHLRVALDVLHLLAAPGPDVVVGADIALQALEPAAERQPEAGLPVDAEAEQPARAHPSHQRDRPVIGGLVELRPVVDRQRLVDHPLPDQGEQGAAPELQRGPVHRRQQAAQHHQDAEADQEARPGRRDDRATRQLGERHLDSGVADHRHPDGRHDQPGGGRLQARPGREPLRRRIVPQHGQPMKRWPIPLRHAPFSVSQNDRGNAPVV